MDIFEKIKNQYSSLSESKQLIAKYFMDEWMEVAFSTTREIAKKLNVSEALIIRFSADLGYSGFKELQNELRNLMRTKLGRTDRIKNFKGDNTDEYARRVFQVEAQNLAHTFEANSEESIEKAVTLLIQARNIYTVGDRNAAAVALLACIHFNEALGNALPLMGMYGTSMDYLRNADEQDCLLAVSLPDYSRYTVDMVKVAKSKGIRIISITDSLFSDLAPFSDVVLLVACDSLTFNFSHVGSIALINTLITHIAAREKEESVKNVSEIEGITSDRLEF